MNASDMTDKIPEVITQDRSNVCDIVSEMLDEPDKHGIYRTTRAYNKLEVLINSARVEAVGWAFAEACAQLDAGEDPRKFEVPTLLPRIQAELNS